MNINKILIANRGEIACRIIQTCRKLGIKTIAIHADIERHAKHVHLADEAFSIAAETPTASYLDIEAIVKIAKDNNADAIHPGYGFLSERSEFAVAIQKAGLKFIGAPVDALDLMGSKAAAKKTMIEAGVPCVPGYHDDNQDVDHLHQQAKQVGFPLLIKASAGGGGKGMKIVQHEDEFVESLGSAKREALKSFGNDHVILERFITKPKHIEVQVFADSHENVVHLFERDCSSQRRYQKIVEEAPSTCISETTKQAMYKAAIEATRAVNYQGAGTIEFIVEADEFFFMEMNTRLQVEHRVTEMVTNTDLVEWQILVADGQALPLTQDKIKCQGHAIQARIYAEDSFNGFLPSTGLLEQVQFKQGDDIIIDTGVEKSNNISIHFDPMIAKTVCWAPSREECIDKVLSNLDETLIVGVKTNISFLSQLINSPEFKQNTIFTNSLDEQSLVISAPQIDNKVMATLTHCITHTTDDSSAWSDKQGWSNSGDYASAYSFIYEGEQINYKARLIANDVYIEDVGLVDTVSNPQFFESFSQYHLCLNHLHYTFDKINHQTLAGGASEGDIISPMPGKILDIRVQQGDQVQQDQTLIVMEAMKMELSLKANCEATVKNILVKKDDVITADTLLVELEPSE